MQLSDQIKARVSLKAIAEASGVVWDKHRSKPDTGEYWCSCPFHAEKTPSFHMTEPQGIDGRFFCHGCQKSGSVIDFVMEMHGLDPRAAMDLLASEGGFSGEMSEGRRRELERDRAKRQAETEREAARKAQYNLHCAQEIWGNAVPIEPASIVWKCLINRGIKLDAMGYVPESLRFAPNLPHRVAGEIIHSGPALVGAIGRGHMIGVHRTWITPNGRAELPDGQKIPKQMLGYSGKIQGQPVSLAPPTPSVIVGEGIETTLAALSVCIAEGLNHWSAEAALSLGSITTKADGKFWTPRKGTKEVLLLGEGSSKDPDGRRGQYEFAANRLRDMGLIVNLRVPWGDWSRDADFADVALAEMRGEL